MQADCDKPLADWPTGPVPSTAAPPGRVGSPLVLSGPAAFYAEEGVIGWEIDGRDHPDRRQCSERGTPASPDTR
ncbi:hypothetical protein GCM10029992_34410 [Glycomyces albus]